MAGVEQAGVENRALIVLQDAAEKGFSRHTLGPCLSATTMRNMSAASMAGFCVALSRSENKARHHQADSGDPASKCTNGDGSPRCCAVRTRSLE